MASLLGPDSGSYCASVVQRVLELAVDPGHDDPRHREHWWSWEDWPVDGRQWSRVDDDDGKQYKLDRDAVSKHLTRKKQQIHQGGAIQSKLRVERKLEGIIWDTDKPRTALRSTGAFDVGIIKPLVRQHDDSDDDDFKPWLPIFAVATDLSHRYTWDAAILKGKATGSVKLNDEAETQFKTKQPFSPFLEHVRQGVTTTLEEEDETMLLDVEIYSCTDAFATRDEQYQIQNKLTEDTGTPSVSVHATCSYIDPVAMTSRMVCVVAEAPVPVPDGIFIDALHDRVAGFVFFQDESIQRNLHVARSDGDGPSNVVIATYVEACDCDYVPLSGSQKDALLEDRALILHRLVDQVATPAAKSVLTPLNVLTPPYGSKLAKGLPPMHIVQCYHTVYRPDPRWPLIPPNSVCLECGKGPKHENKEQRVGKLMTCSKCRVRNFCSRECMMKSWTSNVWSHKYECKRAHEHDLSEVGTSLRQRFHEIAPEIGRKPSEGERILQKAFEKAGEPETLDRTAGSLEDLHEQRQADDKKKRRAAKKKKGKKKK